MPLYDYRCENCGAEDEIAHKLDSSYACSCGGSCHEVRCECGGLCHKIIRGVMVVGVLPSKPLVVGPGQALTSNAAVRAHDAKMQAKGLVPVSESDPVWRRKLDRVQKKTDLAAVRLGFRDDGERQEFMRENSRREAAGKPKKLTPIGT